MQPNALGDAGSGHRVRQFAQATDQAAQQIDLRIELNVRSRDLIFLLINPKCPRDSAMK